METASASRLLVVIFFDVFYAERLNLQRLTTVRILT